jgi:signal transduction histidine kinase
MSAAKKLDSQQVVISDKEPSSEYKKNYRILVVEDEPQILENYREILAPNNVIPIRKSSRTQLAVEAPRADSFFPFEVTLAKNAEEALVAIENSAKRGLPYAMGFFDVLLGSGMNGIDLVKKIFEIDPNMHAVFVTAYQDRNVDSINEYLGTNNSERWSYLNKPFSEGEITQKARQTITLWNLKQIKEVQDQKLSEAYKRLHEGERMTSVAAVARGVGHEFGNLLTQIMGQADLGSRGNEQRKTEALKVILKACDTASHVLDRFKNLAKPVKEGKKQIWLFAPLLEAIELMQHQFSTNNVKLCRIKVEKFQVMANHASLVQVFVNIFVNALHAMQGGGQIDFSIYKEDDYGVVAIRDFGPGIPEEIIEKVSEPFFTTKGDAGTGLGLSICRELIEIHHRGEFSIKNNPTKGVEVVIRIPLKTDDEGETT